MGDLPGANLKNANLTDANLTDADLKNANLEGVNLEGAELEGAEFNDVKSGKIKGRPLSLPDGWSLVDGTLFKEEVKNLSSPDEDDPSVMMADRDLSDAIYNTINDGKPIKRSKWMAWEKENNPQVSKGKTTFKNLDKNSDDKIGTGEFFKFYQRWIQD